MARDAKTNGARLCPDFFLVDPVTVGIDVAYPTTEPVTGIKSLAYHQDNLFDSLIHNRPYGKSDVCRL